jgi:hypothetical protein
VLNSLKQQIMGSAPELSGRLSFAGAEDGVITETPTADD